MVATRSIGAAHLVTYGETLDDEVFKAKVGALSIKQMTRNAKDRRPGSMGFAEVMVLEYNGKKKLNSSYRLNFNKLYKKENALFKDLEPEEDTEPEEEADLFGQETIDGDEDFEE